MLATQPLFSVVIPVRNRTALLARTLASLERQTLSGSEVIVVDDGSTEPIVEVARAFPRLRAKIIASHGRGACAARNTGTEAAAGRYIAYLDSDDIFLPRKLEETAAFLSAADADVLASPLLVWRDADNMQLRPTRGPAPDEDISEYFFVADERTPSSCLVVRTAVAQHVMWDERLAMAQDLDFTIRCIRAGFQFAFMGQPLGVLDDRAPDRISHQRSEGNVRRWLELSRPNLTFRARKGFEAYVLAHEVSRRSRLAALAMILGSGLAGRVRPKVLAKSAVRAMTTTTQFKALAQRIQRGKAETDHAAVAQYVAELEQSAQIALGRIDQPERILS